MSEWQPIESAPTGRKVIAGYPNVLGNWRTVIARKVAALTEESGDESGNDEYDEATDAYYWCAGWYEVNEEQGEDWRMTIEPTHWQPLPEPPQ